jgi:hypothetical protein
MLEKRVRFMISILGLTTQLMFAPAGPIKNYIIALLVVIISIDAINIILEGLKAVKITLTDLNN